MSFKSITNNGPVNNGRHLFSFVPADAGRAKRLLLNLFPAGRRLPNLIRAIRRLINLQPCPSRPPPV